MPFLMFVHSNSYMPNMFHIITQPGHKERYLEIVEIYSAGDTNIVNGKGKYFQMPNSILAAVDHT
jgi:hypothetical protein